MRLYCNQHHNVIFYIILVNAKATPPMSNVYINHIVIIEHVKFGAIEIKLPSKVLHKVYIDFYVNFMQDF